MRAGFLLTLFIVLSAYASFAQNGNYRTRQSGNWNDNTTWERDADGNGSFEETPAAVSPTTPATAGTIFILNTHTVTVAANVSADQVIVQGGGGLLIDNGITLTVVDGTGNDLTLNATSVLSVSGILAKAATAVISGTSATNTDFLSGSVYRHLNTGTEGAIPLATWDANATLEITGYTTGRTMSSSTWNQNFGHVIWNCPAQASTINLNGLLRNVQGDFLIQGTNGNPLQLAPSAPVTINIGRDIAASNNSRMYYSTGGALTLNIGRDFIFNSTNLSGSFFCSFGSATANIARNFSMSASGVLYVGAGTGSTGQATFNIANNFTLQSGVLQENGSSSQCVMNFNNGTSHLFTNTGSIAGTCDYIVGTNDELVIAPTSWIGGVNGTGVTSDFILNGTVVVQSADALGALRVGNMGNIRLPIANRIYNAGSTIIYRNASSSQAIGDGHPSASNVNVTIDNANGVGFASNVNSLTTGGTLSLMNGSLILASTGGTAKTLNIAGNVLSNGGTIASTGPNTDINVLGNGTIVNLAFLPSSNTVRNFTVNKSSGNATLVSSLVVSEMLTLTSGNLVFNNQALTLNRFISYGTGMLAPNAGSTLNIAGPYATSAGTLSFAPGANLLGTLTISRPAVSAVTVNSPLTIATALNLTRGGLSNLAGLAMADGATITRTSVGFLLDNPAVNAPGESYNVTYLGSTTTPALELPTDPEDLGSLTINGGPVNLDRNIVINGNLALNASSLNVGGFSIVMEGNNWIDNGGTIALGTIPIVFNGPNTNIAGSSITPFRDIQVNTGANVTLPSGILTITGNILVQAGGSFDANNGTILLNAPVLQTISANGATLHNITVNKPSGLDVSLTTALNISGVLLIQSPNSDVSSNGLLTLLSTSDGNSGTASIGPLLNNTTVSGDVNIQRFWSAEGTINRYISSPVTNAPVSQLQDDFPITGPFTGSSYADCGPSPCLNDGHSLKYYNEPFNGPKNKGYTGYPLEGMDASVILMPGRGYLAYMWENTSETWDVTGPINRGTIVFPISHTPSTPTPIPDADGWNLVGNPYPSSIVWDNGVGWTRNEIAPIISVPDLAAGVFRTSNYLVPNAGDLPSDIIAAGQAFWVYANEPGASMSINEQAKTNSTGVFYRQSTNPHPVLAVSLTQEGSATDNSYLILHPESTAGYDLPFDGYKMEGDSFAISFTDENLSKWVMYAVPQLSSNAVFPLAVKTWGNKKYSISVEPRDGFELEGWNLYDTQEEKYTSLSDTRNYSFVASGRAGENRFFLVKGQGGVAKQETAVSVYPNPAFGRVTISLPRLEQKAQLLLTNTQGIILIDKTVDIQESTVELDLKGFSPGIYVLIVKRNNATTVHKLAIK